MAGNGLWWQEGVIYQIYPRSFFDSNGDGIGDLDGIRLRLDHLVELGVDAVWLSPVNPSPQVDFGYDVSDYRGIDPMYGSLAKFDLLTAEAHRRGIRVIMDLVLNHTSDRHPWFIESRQSRDNPKSDWYLWRDPKPDGSPPNNWVSIFGGEGWRWVEERQQYYYHMFYPEQPDLNWRNPHVRREILSLFDYWCDRGVDGFRLDVFNAYFKHPDLLDNPPCLGLRPWDRQRHIHDISQPELIPLLEDIRHILDSYPDRYAVGETFMDDGELAVAYSQPGRLHGAFNFSLLETPWDAGSFMRAIQRWEYLNGTDGYPTQVLNNHDNRRSATRYKCGGDDERLKVAAGILLTLRGTPYLYYGEEIGMRDIPVGRSEIQDPIGKRYFPFYRGRDGCRSPMQWDDSQYAGFSTAQPWLKVHPGYPARNLEQQRCDQDSLFHFYRQLIRVRRQLPALRRGMFQPVTVSPRRLLAYLRQTGDETVLVAANFGRRRINLVLGPELARRRWELVLSNRRAVLSTGQFDTFELAGEEFIILKQV
ncbi:MAG: alpha-glucosidase [Anaerolineae bacterium]|nr:alpha-glucosidase [Anaerolineae bacterium]